MSLLFYSYGKFCASHPWEVMVSFLTLSICLFSMGGSLGSSDTSSSFKPSSLGDTCSSMATSGVGCEEDTSLDAIYFITIVRCLCLLYIYNQFRKLYKLGSKYLAGIAGLFTVFSSFIFCSGVINFLNGGFSELNKALPFFLLMMDLPKAVLLAQFALSSRNREELSQNIAKGMATLGPTLTLDTLVETLSIGVGTISGVQRMEELSYFACLSVIVNYIIFMSFFPACLSLVLELSHNRDEGRPSWQLSSLSKVLQLETERTANPVIQRVKLIMSAGLMLVHMLSRWPISDGGDELESNGAHPLTQPMQLLNLSKNGPIMGDEQSSTTSTGVTNETSLFEYYLRRWLAISPEQLVMLGLVSALAIKYIFFDSKENLEQEMQSANGSDLSKSKSLTEAASNTDFVEPIQSTNSMVLTNGRRAGESPRIIVTSQESEVDCTSKGDDDADDDGSDDLAQNIAGLAAHKYHRKQSSRKSSTATNPDGGQANFFLGDDSASELSDDLELVEKEVQTEDSCMEETLKMFRSPNQPLRKLHELQELLNSEDGVKQLSDDEILHLVVNKRISSYKLETVLSDLERCVKIRRILLGNQTQSHSAISNIPYTRYDYSFVKGACCENVIGYMPVPLGIAGPLFLDGSMYQVPMATTEGCLIASTNRGCRALALCEGVQSSITGDAMTRAPVVRFPTASRAAEANNWLNEPQNYLEIKEAFDSTSRFARLIKVLPRIAGRNLYLRFAATTGDAMGMNMVSKGTEQALMKLREKFNDMEVVSLSGNFCSDKKPSAVNWIEGRGKSVVCEARVTGKVISEVLKTNVKSLLKVNNSKNYIGSAIAGSIGGNNAHSANIVAAVFIATGQDPAQCVGSSNCMTILEECDENSEDLYISCTMPSIELGTIGGGTILPPQSACLEVLGVRGSNSEQPGKNAQQLARILCGTVLAAELSLLSALASGDLVRSHMKHNRSSVSINASPSSASITQLSANGSQSNLSAIYSSMASNSPGILNLPTDKS